MAGLGSPILVRQGCIPSRCAVGGVWGSDCMFIIGQISTPRPRTDLGDLPVMYVRSPGGDDAGGRIMRGAPAGILVGRLLPRGRLGTKKAWVKGWPAELGHGRAHSALVVAKGQGTYRVFYI